MDNSMIKRGIGAVVLAVIAALLLGWLLKDKSQERQELIDIKMPNASDMNIPSLSDAVNKVSDSAASIVEGTKEKVADAGNAVITAATGTVGSVKNTVSDTSNAVSETVTNNSVDGKPGFSIRPAQQNETKQIVDNVGTTTTNNTATPELKTEQTQDTIASTGDNMVVASTKKQSNFMPKIVEKKKEVVKAAKAVIAKKPVVKKKAPTATATPTSNSAGKYEIQLLATSSQTRAKRLSDVMKSEGYQSFITQTHRDGKLLYRVRIGGYADRNNAIKAQEGMKKRYQKNFFVQNSLVISK